MPEVTTYTEARANLAALWDKAVEDRETVIIRRRGSEDVALIAASELAGILETAHLVRSPANANRLFSALERVKARTEVPQRIEWLAGEVGLTNVA